MNSTVVVVQRRLAHYRVPLFESLRTRLAARGVRLRLLHGEGTADERTKDDGGHIEWAEPLATRYWLGGKVCWQPFMRQAAGASLVVLTQENKLVNNLLALALPRPASMRLAFWGHGRNMQAQRPDGWRERWKRWTTSLVDWWFVYTDLSETFVREAGFATERITVLNNSIDTSTLAAAVSSARLRPLHERRAALRVGTGPLALFIGSLYGDKRLAFLLEAAVAVQALRPGFQLAIAGSGPDRALVEAAAARHDFIRYLGPVKGQQKADWLAAADLILNPGLVGLGILDGFVAGVPMLTTDCKLHSPEIAYLVSGVNGVMTPDRVTDYVAACVSLIDDPAERSRLAAGALASSQAFSIEQMADRFCEGILKCLHTPRR